MPRRKGRSKLEKQQQQQPSDIIDDADLIGDRKMKEECDNGKGKEKEKEDAPHPPPPPPPPPAPREMTEEEKITEQLARVCCANLEELYDYEPFYAHSKCVNVLRTLETTHTLGEFLSMDMEGSLHPEASKTIRRARLPPMVFDLIPRQGEGEEEKDNDDYDYENVYVQSVRIMEYENEFPVGLYWTKEDFSRHFDPLTHLQTCAARGPPGSPRGRSGIDQRNVGLFDRPPVCTFESEFCKRFINVDTDDVDSDNKPNDTFERICSCKFPEITHMSKGIASHEVVLSFGGCRPEDIYEGCSGFQFPSRVPMDDESRQLSPLFYKDVRAFLSDDHEKDGILGNLDCPIEDKWIVLRGDHAVADAAHAYAIDIRKRDGIDKLRFPDQVVLLYYDTPNLRDNDAEGKKGIPFAPYQYVIDDFRYSTSSLGSEEEEKGEGRGQSRLDAGVVSRSNIHSAVVVNGKVAKYLFEGPIRNIMADVAACGVDGRKVSMDLAFFKTSVSLNRYRAFIPNLPSSSSKESDVGNEVNVDPLSDVDISPMVSDRKLNESWSIVAEEMFLEGGEGETETTDKRSDTTTNIAAMDWSKTRTALETFRTEVFDKKLTFRAKVEVRYIVFKKTMTTTTTTTTDTRDGEKRRFCANALA